MSLTGPPPPLPPVLAATSAGSEDHFPAAVIGILDARGPDRLTSSVSDVLHAASGPGNIITGKVAEIRPDGTVFLATPSGAELSFRHPPEVSLQLGSTITLRLVATVPAPQAILLAVDGRSVAGVLARAGGAQSAPPAAAGPTAGSPPGAPPAPSAVPARAVGPTDFGIGISTQLVAALAQEQSAPPGAAGAPRGGLSGAIVTEADATAITAPVVGVLVRGAAPKPGGTTPPVGTRYLLTISAIGPPSQGDSEMAPEPGPPGMPANSASPNAAAPSPASPMPGTSPAAAAMPADGTVPAAPDEARPDAASIPPGTARPAMGAGAAPIPDQTPPVADTPAAAASASPSVTAAPADLSDFTPQTALLAGRVLAARQPGEALIETGLGTLAVPVPDGVVALGSAVHLKVVAVARPAETAPPVHPEPGSVAASDAAAPDAPPAAPPQGALQEALGVLAALQPALAHEAEQLLVLPPGAQLAALIFGFLTGAGAPVSRRWNESPARAALDAIDRSDLREKLDDDAGTIGGIVPPPQRGDWTVTVLPYLGAASLQPARLYRRSTEGSIDGDGVQTAAAGQRFVLEIEFRRLGPFQFDGLVRDRRFDLVLRTVQPLDPDLQTLIHAVFRETAGIGGYAGELVFGKLGRFPLLPAASPLAGQEISA